MTAMTAMTDRGTLPPRPAIAILDMDGVLLSLPLQTERLREALGRLFAAAGVQRDFRPLLQTLERTCGDLARRDPTTAETLRAAAWRLIDDEERRAAAECRPLPGARSLLRALDGGNLPAALWTNNDRQAAELALRRSGIELGWFFAIEARNGPATIKPGADPLLRIIDAAPERPRTAYVVGDHPADMQSARMTITALADQRSDTQVIPIGLPRDGDRRAAETLEQSGARSIARDLPELARVLLGPLLLS